MNGLTEESLCSLCYDKAVIMRKGNTFCKICCEIYKKVERENNKVIENELKKMQDLINSK